MQNPFRDRGHDERPHERGHDAGSWRSDQARRDFRPDYSPPDRGNGSKKG